jgi:cytoskeletal protein RodZ
MTLNPKELARIGDPTAIAAFINRSLNSKGIKANVSGENGYLRVMLISAQIPPQEALVTFVRNGMTGLGVESIHTVQVGGYQEGNDFPAWQEEIQLLPSHDNMYFDNDDDDDDDDDDNYMLPESNDFMDQAHSNHPMSGDDGFSDDDFASDEQVEEEMEEPQPEKKPLLSKPLLILIPVLLLGAIVGGVFLFNYSIQFLSSKGSESPSPSPSPSSPSPTAKASSPAKEVPNTTKTASPTPKPASPSASPTTSASPKPASPTPKASPSASPKAASPTPKASPSTSAKPASPTPKASPSGQASKTVSKPWYDAVNKALAASNAVQKAKTPEEWQKVVTLWEEAIDLMKKVPQSDANYALAQQKAVEYEKNLTYAKGNAGSEQ